MLENNERCHGKSCEKLLGDLVDRVLSLYNPSFLLYCADDFCDSLRSRSKEDKDLARNRNLEEVENRLRLLIYMIVGSLATKPRKDLESDLSVNSVVVESDLHGDISAFFFTLLRNGMVEFNRSNPIGIIFLDPVEKKEYTLEKLEKRREEFERKFDGKEFASLMFHMQLLPDVIPTERYGRYINCGDFVDRGQQSEQMVFLIRRLYRLYSNLFGDYLIPRILIGNHENFYIAHDIEYSIRYAIANGANNTFSTGRNATEYGVSKNCMAKFSAISGSIREAVKSGELCLVYSIGTTLFSHAVITRGMVTELGKYFGAMARALVDSPTGWNDPNYVKLKERIQNLAVELKKMTNLVLGERDLTEIEIGKLVLVLNEFNIIRVILVERHGIEVEKGQTVLFLPGEEEIIQIVQGLTRESITWIREEDLKMSDLIPGLKYIVGHDANRNNKQWPSTLRMECRISCIDSQRSLGYSEIGTAANYFQIPISFLLEGHRFSGKSAPLSEVEYIMLDKLRDRALKGIMLLSTYAGS
ncbi:MAG: hypothetical protein LBI29_02025 [Rickettsiales bacterium]|nr:hypothetical protein [Rickettsiales bacterium]